MFDLLVILIPVFPLIAVILNGLLGNRYSHDRAHQLAWGSVLLSFLCAISVFVDTARSRAARAWSRAAAVAGSAASHIGVR